MNTPLPELATAIPGPESRALAERLARVECAEVTDLRAVCAPIFWESALGSAVTDVDGNTFVDLLSGFGASVLGHAHPDLAAAISAQARTLPHAMGDVYPARKKVELLEALDAALPADLGHAILSTSGSDAVESALKTATIATGKTGVVAFEGAYHGLGFGALAATHRRLFREPFEAALSDRVRFAAWGDIVAARAICSAGDVGAILVEPIQGRGGVRPAPDGFLAGLRELADRTGAQLIADEVYTGLGRTGQTLACEHDGVLPDVVALGKALGGGFPISACVGRAAVMDTWPRCEGEAVHTSTHLGNPMGCAAARVVLARLRDDKLAERAAELGAEAIQRLRHGLEGNASVVDVRGRGLMIGVEVARPEIANAAVAAMLQRGWILLGEGARGEVLSLTPALTIERDLLLRGCDALVESLA